MAEIPMSQKDDHRATTSVALASPEAALVEAALVEEGRTLLGRMRGLLTQPWPIRVALGCALVQVIASAVLIALGSAAQPGIPTYPDTNGTIVSMPTVGFICAFVFWVLGWSLLLAGAIRGHWALRLLVLAVFTYTLLDSFEPQPGVIAWDLPILGIWLWAFVVPALNRWARRRGSTRMRDRVPFMLSWVIVLVLVAAQYGAYWFHAAEAGTQQVFLFAAFTTNEASTVAYLFALVVFVASASYVEWGRAATSRGLGVARRLRVRVTWAAIPLVTVLGLALLVVGYSSSADSLAGLSVGQVAANLALHVGWVLVAGVLLLGLLRLAARRRPIGTRVPALAIVLAAVVSLGATTLPEVVSFTYEQAALDLGGPAVYPDTLPESVSVYTHASTSDSPTFSLVYSHDWLVDSQEATPPADIVTVSFSKLADQALDANVVEMPLASVSKTGLTPARLVNALVLPYIAACDPGCAPVEMSTPAPSDAIVPGWQTSPVAFMTTPSSPDLQGEVWWRVSDGAFWAIFTIDQRDSFAQSLPYFAQMAASLRPDLAAAPVAPNAVIGALWAVNSLASAPDYLTYGMIPLALCLACGLPLLLLGRRRGAIATGVFLLALGVRVSLYGFGALSGHLNLPIPQALEVSTFDLAAGVLTLAILLMMLARHAARSPHVVVPLLMLDLSLLVLAAVDAVFAQVDALSAVAIVQALLLLAAFVWSLLTSDTFFTREDPSEPRVARGLLSIGYSMLATVVLVFAALLPTIGVFSLGDWASAGVVLLGQSLAVAIFLLGLAQVWERGHVAAKDAEVHTSQPVAAPAPQ